MIKITSDDFFNEIEIDGEPAELVIDIGVCIQDFTHQILKATKNPVEALQIYERLKEELLAALDGGLTEYQVRECAGDDDSAITW